MLEKYLKSYSEKFAIPFIKFLRLLNLKPNTVSIIGLVVIVIGSYYFYTNKRSIGIILIFIGSAIDGLDGPYARTYNLASQKGALLDSLLDRLGEMIIWSVILLNYTISDIQVLAVISVIVSSNLIPYMRAKSELYGLENKKGIASRPERVIFAVLFMFFNLDFAYLYVFAFITWITALQRFIFLYKNLK